MWAALVGTHEMLACHCLPCPTQDIFFTNTWVYKLMCVSLEGTNGLLLPKLTNKAFSSFPLAFNMARETTPVGFLFFFFLDFNYFLKFLWAFGEKKTFVSRSAEQSKGG